ncbi:MAG: hypothetical protein JWL73_2670 [Actinomycetia bacterium]|nr:hypothetical protein [Actinomycetes bacterium]
MADHYIGPARLRLGAHGETTRRVTLQAIGQSGWRGMIVDGPTSELVDGIVEVTLLDGEDRGKTATASMVMRGEPGQAYLQGHAPFGARP